MSVEDICKIGESDWRVVGVDPAPANKSTVCFLGENGLAFKDLKHQELLHFIQSCKGKPKVLVVWDAPLTGPPGLEHLTNENYPEGYFTKRWIEKYFSRDSGCKTPTGISTRNYSELSHWTITKAFTGLPLLGPYCEKDQLPFNHLVSAKTEFSEDRPNIVETHPAVALFLWLRSALDFLDPTWKYKADTNWKKIFPLLKERLNGFLPTPERVKTHDELDAFVAWALGCLYTGGKKDEVQILGDRCTGSMLLPAVEYNDLSLKDHFGKWLKSTKTPCDAEALG